MNMRYVAYGLIGIFVSCGQLQKKDESEAQAPQAQAVKESAPKLMIVKVTPSTDGKKMDLQVVGSNESIKPTSGKELADAFARGTPATQSTGANLFGSQMFGWALPFLSSLFGGGQQQIFGQQPIGFGQQQTSGLFSWIQNLFGSRSNQPIYYGQGYGMPYQYQGGYPYAQQFPNGQIPNQPFPNGQIPNQPFPNGQIPNQPFPNQPFPGFPNGGIPQTQPNSGIATDPMSSWYGYYVPQTGNNGQGQIMPYQYQSQPYAQQSPYNYPYAQPYVPGGIQQNPYARP